MSDKRQSSVEWLHEQLTLTWYDFNSSKDLLEQAKAMHKEEHDKTSEVWYNEGTNVHNGRKYQNFEQYYKETFNSDET